MDFVQLQLHYFLHSVN